MEFGAKLGISVMDGWTRLNCCSFDAYNEAGKSSGDGRTVTHAKGKGGHHLLRIMIVEDEPPINRLLQALIEACGSEYRIVASAYNGQEALDMIEEVQPDVVFTDVKMPCMDGLELTKQLHARCVGTLVVVISGYGDYQTVRAMLQQDVFDYLLKPVQPNVLNNLLQQIEKAVLDRQQQHMTQVFLQAMKNGTLRHCLFPATHHMCFIAGIGCIGSYPSCLPHNYSLDTHAWPTILNQFDGFNAWQVPGATNAEQIFILSFPHYNREKIELSPVFERFCTATTKYISVWQADCVHRRRWHVCTIAPECFASLCSHRRKPDNHFLRHSDRSVCSRFFSKQRRSIVNTTLLHTG